MSPESIRKDPAFTAMTLDILNNVLSRAGSPAELVDYLAKEVSELTGARCVVFIQYLGMGAGTGKRVLCVNPPRWQSWSTSPSALRLYEITQDLAATVLWEPEERSETTTLLHQEGFGLSMAVPLNVGHVRGGAMLVLGLPDIAHIETEVRLLNTLSTIVALVMRNAFLFENQEILIRARTRELELANTTLNCMMDAVYWINQDATIWMTNPAASKMLGYTAEEFSGLSIKDINPDFNMETWALHWDRVRELKNHHLETTHRTKDGRNIPVYLTINHLTFGGKEYHCAISKDITEYKKLEQQLRQSQKMEAIGQLAGGVAHDFNNILTVIMGYGNILKEAPQKDENLSEAIDQIIAASEKAAQLTNGLLAFSRKQIMKPQTVNLNSIVQNVQKFLIRIIGEDIRLKSIFNKAALMVEVDSGQIEQVLINLATNSRDAMDKGGILTIETGIQTVDEAYVLAHGMGRTGRYAVIIVSDTGQGMDGETRSRIFEPFFTTKATGKGTGLGMAIVYGIVQQHNGFINVYSEPGQGTTFRIYLPIDEKQQTRENLTSLPPTPKRGTETILLAEDDPAVLKLMEMILTRFGYQVITAIDGQECIDRFTANRDRIGLVVMDMIMPNKNGNQAYKEIRQLEPDTRVLFSSGYTSDFILSRGVCEDELELIMKPVQPYELLNKVREILDRP